MATLSAQEGFWTSLQCAGGLLEDEQTATSGALALLPLWIEADPELHGLHLIAQNLEHTLFIEPALELLETTPLNAAFFATQSDDEAGVPLAFLSELVVTDALSDALHLLKLILQALDLDESD